MVKGQAKSMGHARIGYGLSLLLFLTVLQPIRSRIKPSKPVSPSADKIEYVSSLGGSVTSVAVSGTIAYAGQGSTFTAFAISPSGKMTPLSKVILPRFARYIEVNGSLASIADGSGGLQIIDISNPLDVETYGSFATAGTADDVDVVGNFAYLVSTTPFSSTLQILDVTNPITPVLLSDFPASYGSYNRIEVADGLAFLAGSWGLNIINVADPTQPALEGIYQNGYAVADVQVEGKRVILVREADPYQTKGLDVIDVSIPTSPTLVGRYTSPPWNLTYYSRLQVSGDLAYVGGKNLVGGINLGLDVIDFSVATTPTLIHSIQEFGAMDFQIIDSRAYLASGEAGLQILDFPLGTDPILLGRYSLFGRLQDVQVEPPYLYTTSTSQRLQVLDITRPEAPALLTANSPYGGGQGLDVIGNIAYLNLFNYGIEIYDVTDPVAPTLLSRYDPDRHGSYTALTVNGDYAYIGEVIAGIHVVNIRIPTLPEYVSTVGNVSSAGPQAMKVVGNLVFAAAGNDGLVIVDVTNPALPQIIGRYNNIWANGIDVVGTLAYVSIVNPVRSLLILDISDPTTPTFVSQYLAPQSELGEIEVVNGLAFIADRPTGLLVVDVADPFTPILYESYTSPGGVNGIDVSSDYIYLANGEGGLHVVRLAGSVEPTPTPSPEPTYTPMLTVTPTETPTLTPAITSTPTPTPTPGIGPIPKVYYLPLILR